MYYDISADIAAYPEAWLYIITGGRGRGKTYSTLSAALQNDIDFIFIKRAMDDVDLICSGSGRIGQAITDYGVNLSPFAAINRDQGTNINAFSIRKGIGGFWHTDINSEGKITASGSPVGMIFALNAVTKYKGFELASSKIDQWIIFDEFIPNIYDRVNVHEGKQLLDFYKTVSRDRVQRGLREVKLICLANATNINNPVFNEIEIVDTVAEMQASGQHQVYDPDRGIFIHLLEDDEEFNSAEENTGLYKAMADTAWGRVSYSNEFAYNDFSSVKKAALKNYICVTGYQYRNELVYIYYNEGKYYITNSRSSSLQHMYNLNRENEQKAFFNDWIITLRSACIADQVYFKKYSYYNLIINYKKEFKL